MPLTTSTPNKLREFREFLKALGRYAKPTILEEVANEAVLASQDSFLRKRTPDGKLWAPYKGKKGARGRLGLLIKKGGLLGGLKKVVSGGSAGVNSTDWKSPFHLFTYRRLVARTVVKRHKKRFVEHKKAVRADVVRPARRWLPGDLRTIPRMWQRRFDKILKRARKRFLSMKKDVWRTILSRV